MCGVHGARRAPRMAATNTGSILARRSVRRVRLGRSEPPSACRAALPSRAPPHATPVVRLGARSRRPEGRHRRARSTVRRCRRTPKRASISADTSDPVPSARSKNSTISGVSFTGPRQAPALVEQAEHARGVECALHEVEGGPRVAVGGRGRGDGHTVDEVCARASRTSPAPCPRRGTARSGGRTPPSEPRSSWGAPNPPPSAPASGSLRSLITTLGQGGPGVEYLTPLLCRRHEYRGSTSPLYPALRWHGGRQP